MPVVLFDASRLHPDDLTGIVESETQLCGVVNNYSVRRLAVPFEPIDLYAGSDRTLRVFIKTPNLNIVNLTGAQGILTVKTDKSASETTFTKSTMVEGQGAIGSPDQGEMFFYIVPGDTSAIAARQYVYDIRLTLMNGKSYTVLDGIINVQNSVG